MMQGNKAILLVLASNMIRVVFLSENRGHGVFLDFQPFG